MSDSPCRPKLVVVPDDLWDDFEAALASCGIRMRDVSPRGTDFEAERS